MSLDWADECRERVLADGPEWDGSDGPGSNAEAAHDEAHGLSLTYAEAEMAMRVEQENACTHDTDGTCLMPEDVCANAGECMWDKTYQYEEPDE